MSWYGDLEVGYQEPIPGGSQGARVSVATQYIVSVWLDRMPLRPPQGNLPHAVSYALRLLGASGRPHVSSDVEMVATVTPQILGKITVTPQIVGKILVTRGMVAMAMSLGTMAGGRCGCGSVREYCCGSVAMMRRGCVGVSDRVTTTVVWAVLVVE